MSFRALAMRVNQFEVSNGRGERLSPKAEVPYFPIYNLRHVFCTRLSWVAPDAIVQRAMRHSSPETKGVVISWGSFTRFESTSNERMKRPIKDVIRYIFVTVASCGSLANYGGL